MVCFTVCCPQCGTIYDEDAHHPCLGECLHTVCHSCLTTSEQMTDCPVCGRESAFQAKVQHHNVTMLMKWMRREMEENEYNTYIHSVEKLDSGTCTSCGTNTEKLHVCVDCKKRVAKLERKNDTWMLQNDGQHLQLLKSVSICAQCAQSTHGSHQVIRLRTIENLPQAVTSLITKYAAMMDDQYKMMEGRCRKWKDIFYGLEVTKAHVVLLSQKTLDYARMTSDDPMFASVLKNSWDTVVKCHDQDQNLLKRVKMFFLRDLAWAIKTAESGTLIARELESKKCLEEILKVLKNGIPMIPSETLSDEAARRIDDDVDNHMRALLAKKIEDSRVPAPPGSKILKYEVILEEFQHFYINFEATKQAFLKRKEEMSQLLMENTRRTLDLSQRRAILELNRPAIEPKLYTWGQVEFRTIDYNRFRDLAEKQLEFDEATVKWLELSQRRKMATLMMYRFLSNQSGGLPDENETFSAIINKFEQHHTDTDFAALCMWRSIL